MGWYIFCFVWRIIILFANADKKQNQKEPTSRNGLFPSEKDIYLKEGNVSKGQIIGGTVLSWGKRKSVVRNVAEMSKGIMGFGSREVTVMKCLCWERMGKTPVETGAGKQVGQDLCLRVWQQQGWRMEEKHMKTSNNGRPRWEQMTLTSCAVVKWFKGRRWHKVLEKPIDSPKKGRILWQNFHQAGVKYHENLS